MQPEKTDPPADDVDPQNPPADDVDPDDVDPDADPNADPADDDGDPEGADKLGDPGKKALATMKTKLAAAKAELRELRKVKAAADDAEPTPEQAAQAKANTKILRAEIRAAAKGVLADPTDAYKFLDLTEFEVDDDGEVDREQLDDALAELVKSKPYLAATKGPGKRFQGGADGGPRGGQPKSLDQQIADAEKAGDWAVARRLKLSKLAALSKK